MHDHADRQTERMYSQTDRWRDCMLIQIERQRECMIRQIDEKKRVQNFNDPSGKEEALGLFFHQFYA